LFSRLISSTKVTFPDEFVNVKRLKNVKVWKKLRPYSTSEQNVACHMRPFYLSNMAHYLNWEAQNK
jgi:hypothetical protein